MARNPLIRPRNISKGKSLPKSAGILDDFAIRKVLHTKEGTIEHTPTNANDIVNKTYADLFVKKSGDTMTGNLQMLGNNNILLGGGGNPLYTMKIGVIGHQFHGDQLDYFFTIGNDNTEPAIIFDGASGVNGVLSWVSGSDWFKFLDDVNMDKLTASLFVKTDASKTLESFDLFGTANTFTETQTFTKIDLTDGSNQIVFDSDVGLGFPTILSGIAGGTLSTVTLPNITGVLASLAGNQTFAGKKTFAVEVIMDNDLTVAGEIGGTRMLLQCGERANVVAPYGNNPLDTAGLVGVTGSEGWRMLRAGSITGGSLQFNCTAFTSEGAADVAIRLNNSVVFTVTHTVTGTGVQGVNGTQARGTTTFSAGDVIRMTVSNGSTGVFTIDDIVGLCEIVYDT